MQVDGVALLATDFATGDVDAVFDQQVKDVTQDANSVLAVDFDTHGRGSEQILIRSRATFEAGDGLSVKNM